MRSQKTCSIIIPTHSSYIDVCNDFVRLFKKNWSDCQFELIVSVCGENKSLEDSEIATIYCGEKATLTECVRIASIKQSSMYYLVFLGDAFIYKRINNYDILSFLSTARKNSIKYCRLYPLHAKYSKKTIDNLLVKIDSRERYAHSFIAFLANRDFINNEFYNGTTDLSFEVKYLELAENKGNHKTYSDRCILLNNIFHIIPGIEKGKWNRISWLIIKIFNNEIRLNKRHKISYIYQLALVLRDLIITFMPDSIGKYIRDIGKYLITNR